MLRTIHRRTAWALLVALLLAVAPAFGAVRETRVALKDGKLHVADLSTALCRAMDLPGVPLGSGEIDLRSPPGKLFLSAVNLSLGDSGHVSLDGSKVLLRVDTDRFDSRCECMSRAVRVIAAEMNPKATELQAKRWGLFLPEKLDDHRPLVLLIHGVDSDRGILIPMGELLTHSGYQVAYFCYPGDQSIEDSAAMLRQRLTTLHEQHPSLTVDIVAHSMGGLVSRDYIESPGYAGGVDRLILVGTPNAGSGLARLRFFLSCQQHYNLWRHDPDWSLSWWFTEGFGEAGWELSPDSKFLKKMSSLPRREGVRYTIIAGTQNTASRISADCVQSMSGWIGGRPSHWWGFRHCKAGLQHAANRLRHTTGEGDGAVSVSSAKLKGVDDLVLVPADHVALFYPIDGNPPGAWSAIRDRLAR